MPQVVLNTSVASTGVSQGLSLAAKGSPTASQLQIPSYVAAAAPTSKVWTWLAYGSIGATVLGFIYRNSVGRSHRI